MNRTGKILLPAVVVALTLTGCRSNQNQTQPTSDDPASANLANADNVTTAGNENPPPPPADQSSASSEAPPPQGSDQYSGAPGYDESAGYDDTAYDVASDPPPDLPDYDQPPCPGDNYIWTPGYWSYAQAGYYWVPGAWVMAPYVGALWTPGYWGWYGNRYHWYAGYWGPHVGFYGGVNYGFGYGGNGYEGGYWRSNAFYYNTAVTRVNVTVIRNVYNYRVTNISNTRVSFNGGHGGLDYRPTPAQVAARNERHVAPLPVQRTVRQTAMQNRAQFASENHGRPQTVAETRPMNGGRTAPAARAEDFRPEPAPTARPEAGRPMPGRPQPESRPSAGTPAPMGAPRPVPGAGVRPSPGRPAPEARPAPQPSRPESRPQPVNRPQPEARPAPQPNRPMPGSRPAPQPTNRPQPEARPAPAPNRPAPESRPAPQPRPESRPQPESRPAPPPSRPAPEARPAPQARPEARPAPESRPAPPKQQPRGEKKPDDKRPQ